MGYNCAWLSSAKLVSAGLTNAVFQTSIAFVYLASTHLFAEPLTFPRMVGVGMSIAGSGLASGLVHFGVSPPLSGQRLEAAHGTVMGVMLALLASLGVTAYQVFFRQLFGHLKGDWRFLAYFGAWVSVWHVLVILPMAILASVLGIETLVLPSGKAALAGTLTSSALASTVNALYLCIVMWGSPMLLPCASALSVPLTVALDAVFHGARPTPIECTGNLMVFISVVLIMELYSPALRHWLSTARAGESGPNAVTKLGRGTPPVEV
jgi:drug/metabolite transporter (DMT)-like permease